METTHSHMRTRRSALTPVKQEENVEVELDVSGDVEEGMQSPQVIVEAPVPSPRLRRLRRQNPRYSQASDYVDPDLHSADVNVESRSDQNYDPEHDIEMEIQEDVQLVQRSAQPSMPRRVPKSEIADHGQVLFRFDSSQRKRQVIIHNSERYPGRASEWYFARKNATTNNETYRCVQCRRYREEVKRGVRVDTYNRPEARITVHFDRFLVHPDEPLGEHICNFENNENTLLHHVWSKRALNKANTELRLHPEKPKAKFENLIKEIRHGSYYSFLTSEERDKIVDELINSKKGFNSRRRSFARNNRYAVLMRDQLKGGDLEDEYDDLGEEGQSMHFLCGMPRCTGRFLSADERAKHRSYSHPGVLFIDSNEDLKHYENIIRGEELIVADEQEVTADQHRTYRTVQRPGTSAETANEAEYEVIRTEHGEDFDEKLEPEQNRYLNQVDALLSNIKEHALSVLNDPARRRDAITQLGNLNAFFEDLSEPPATSK